MNKSAFRFFEVPERPPKPRTVGLAVGSDVGLPLQQLEDFLSMHHDLVDWVKFADHIGLASRYLADLWSKKIGIYHKYDIKLTIGGVPFELAFRQNNMQSFKK